MGARDQAARVRRPEPAETPEPATREPAALGEALRTQVAEEAKGRTADAPVERAETAPAAKPAAAPPAEKAAPAKSGRRKRIMIGAMLAVGLAIAAYATDYILVGRFFISTDDAYVRANNTMLGARVAGHIVQILPGDNALVHKGDVIIRIDDGDYRI